MSMPKAFAVSSAVVLTAGWLIACQGGVDNEVHRGLVRPTEAPNLPATTVPGVEVTRPPVGTDGTIPTPYWTPLAPAEATTAAGLMASTAHLSATATAFALARPTIGFNATTSVVYFTSPQFDSVGGPAIASPHASSPFSACLEVRNVTIGAAGSAEPGTGHHHILVDPSPEEVSRITSGQSGSLPRDAKHLHLDQGEACIDVSLPPGPHMLLAVVADSTHVPLKPPVINVMQVEVDR